MPVTPRVVLCSFVLGCAAAPARPDATSPETKRETLPAPASAPAPVAVAEPEPVAVVEPEPIAEPEPTTAPSPTTCVVHKESWYSGVRRALRSRSGRVYGTIGDADDLTLRTDGKTAVVEFVGHGLRLRSSPRAGDLPVYLRDEHTFKNVLRVGPEAPLGWEVIAGPRLRVTPPRDARVRFVQAPAAEVGCESLSLVAGVGVDMHVDHRLRARGPVAVAASGGGPAILRLHLARPVDVRVLVRVDGYAKIAWPIADGALAGATVDGWIEAAALEPLVERHGGEPGGTLSGAMSATSDWGGCGREHPLLVDAGRGPEEVGTILAGTRARARKRRGEHVRVEIVGPSVQSSPPPFVPQRGINFLLTPAAAEDCSR